MSASERTQIVRSFRERIRLSRRTKLTSDERQTLVSMFVERLVEMAGQGTDTRTAIQNLCLDEIALLLEGYPENTLAASYLPDYTKQLKQAIADRRLLLTKQNSHATPEEGRRHYALDDLSFDQLTQQTLRERQGEENGDQSSSPLELEDYLSIIQTWLNSKDPAELIAGIAAATGRSYEVVLSFSEFGVTQEGQFNQLNLHEHPYLLLFSPSKGSPIQVLTISSAVNVLAAINQLRGQRNLADFIHRTDRKIQSALEPLEHTSIEDLQSLYKAIALHFFCPLDEAIFSEIYLSHVQAVPLSNRLMHLSERGVKNADYGLLEIPQDLASFSSQASPDQSLPNQVLPAVEGIEAVAVEPATPSTEFSSILQVVQQQAATISLQAETISRLREDLAYAQQHQPAGESLRIEELQAALERALAEQRRQEVLTETYRQRLAVVSSVLTGAIGGGENGLTPRWKEA